VRGSWLLSANAFRSAPMKRHEDHSSLHEVLNLQSRGQPLPAH
jgi:hypothetical protein